MLHFSTNSQVKISRSKIYQEREKEAGAKEVVLTREKSNKKKRIYTYTHSIKLRVAEKREVRAKL